MVARVDVERAAPAARERAVFGTPFVRFAGRRELLADPVTAGRNECEAHMIVAALERAIAAYLITAADTVAARRTARQPHAVVVVAAPLKGQRERQYHDGHEDDERGSHTVDLPVDR